MRKLIVLTVFLTTVLAGQLFAQSAPPAEAMAAARELVIAMRLADRMKAMIPILHDALKPVIVQNQPTAEKDYDKVAALINAEMIGRTSELVDLTAVLYAQNFSVAEMRDITAFYQTPTGRRLAEKLPELAQQGVAIGQKFGQKLGADIQQRIIEELRKRGHNI